MKLMETLNKKDDYQHKIPAKRLFNTLCLGAALLMTGCTSNDTTPPLKEEAVQFTLPQPSGSYKIGTTELHLVDHDRPDPWKEEKKREIMINVWYPAQNDYKGKFAPYMRPKAAAQFEKASLASLGINPNEVDLGRSMTHAFLNAPVAVSNNRYPVVLYSPSIGTPRSFGTVNVEELASRGYIVVTIDHTYETSVVEFPDDRIEVASLPELDAEVLKKVIDTRISDVRFVLDQLQVIQNNGNPDAENRHLPIGLSDALDLSRVGMFGHSAGGFTAAEAMNNDQRIDAGINLDGSLGYHVGNGDLGEVTETGLDRPFMIMGAGTSGSENLPHTHLNSPDWKLFWENSSEWKLDLYIPDGEHYSFVDHQVIVPQLVEKLNLPDMGLEQMIGTVDPDQIVASQRAYITAFFDEHLKNKPQRLLKQPSPSHPDVVFVE